MAAENLSGELVKTELGINFQRVPGKKGHSKTARMRQRFGEIIKHFIQPFRLRRIFGQFERRGLVHVLIGAGDE